nr:phospholipase SGR2 [Ipomoea batatas]
MSSPFPMEWMYTGPNEKKVSFPDKSEVSLDQNVTAIVDDESLVSDRSKNIVNMLGNDIMEVDQSCPGLVEECTEFLCHPVSPPALSDSDEAAVNSVDIKQHDDRNDLGPSEQDMTKIEELESDKDKMIRSLREEIDLLTAKIRALDCWHGPEGKKGQETNTINQSEKDFPKESDSHKNYTPCIKYTKLAFKVDTFFAVGSPLGVFLSLRNVRIGIGKGQEYWEEEKINEEMPACRQMFNIFHPFDPVAYRIEPLVCKEYVNKRPIIIPYHRGGKRLHIGFQEFTEGVASHSHAFVNHIHSARVRICYNVTTIYFLHDRPSSNLAGSCKIYMFCSLTMPMLIYSIFVYL